MSSHSIHDLQIGRSEKPANVGRQTRTIAYNRPTINLLLVHPTGVLWTHACRNGVPDRAPLTPQQAESDFDAADVEIGDSMHSQTQTPDILARNRIRRGIGRVATEITSRD